MHRVGHPAAEFINSLLRGYGKAWWADGTHGSEHSPLFCTSLAHPKRRSVMRTAEYRTRRIGFRQETRVQPDGSTLGVTNGIAPMPSSAQTSFVTA